MPFCLLVVAALLLSAAPAQAKLQTPGYKGVTKAPKLLPQEAPTPVQLGSGTDPQVLVDAGGTAHVVWNEDRGANEDVTHYCRLKRGAKACDASASLIPPLDTSDPGNSPNANRDFDGPRIVSLGDELGILTQRSFRTAAPDGQPSQANTFLFLSQDGGTTFNPPSLVGTGPLSGQQAVFGAADAPRIGLISDTATGGPFFQALEPGRFTRRQLSFGGDGIDSSVGRAGDLPIVAYQNLAGTTFVKTWSGQGDIYDPGTWSNATVPNADDPLLASGPSGPFLMYARGTPREYVVSKVTPPATLGAPVRVTNAPSMNRRDLFQSAGGRLFASFVDSSGDAARLVTRTSADGRSWSSQLTLLQAARNSDVWSSDIGAAFDGGGFAVGQLAPGGAEGPIVAAAFGERAATGRPGLGSLAGGAADPTIVERCQRVEFAAVDIETPEGCLLSAADRKGVKVSEGTIKLNGLELVPDPGVKILLNARERTIDSTGKVTIQARAPGIDPVQLLKDEIHLRLGIGGTAPAGSPCKGDILAGFDAGKAVLKGFPIRGRIEIYLEDDRACIPVSLELPKAFGGIRGDAVLRTSNPKLLHLESLDIRAATIPIGPILIRDLRITYARSGERWTGGALITFPPGATMGATVVFSEGQFRGATITLGFHPGIPLFAGVFLNRVTAGLEVEPLKLIAGVRVGAFPLPALDTFAIAVDGRLEASFGDPFTLHIGGTLSLYKELRLVSADVVIRSDGYFSAKATLNFDFEVVSVRGDAKVWVDGPREEFGGSVSAAVSVFGFKIASASAVLSSKALGICGPSPVPFVDAGFVIVWGEGAKALWGDCDLEDYGQTEDRRSARAAQAGTLSVPQGTPAASLRVTGTGGVPSLVVVSPSGERIVPSKTGGAAVLAENPAKSQAFVALPKPAAGTWRVEAAPGSVPIAAVDSALAKADPKVSGSVDRTRTLRWRFPNADGRSLTFVEKGAGGERAIGAGTGTSGTLKIAPGEGPGGKRTISAVVTQDGTPRRRIDVATYTAPPPARPGRVSKPRARRTRGAVSVSWGAASGATSYIVRADVSDGRRLAFMTTKRTLRVANITKAEKVTLRVQGRNAKGRLGPAAVTRPK